jgi:formylglycine-generating enzyme required for sulfatase activity
VTVT